MLMPKSTKPPMMSETMILPEIKLRSWCVPAERYTSLFAARG